MNTKEFVDYVYSFYGKDGIYFIDGLTPTLTHKDIDLATKALQSIPDREFWADSLDREMVRDILTHRISI